MLQPRERLIVALDVSSVEAARPWSRGSATRSRSTRSAISSPLPAGLLMRATLADAGKRVFLDLKLHDIGNTVAKGVKSVARLGASFLTVHAYPQTMKAAVEAREGDLRILAVTVLTSYDDRDLAAAGYDRTRARTCRRARGAGARHRCRRPRLLGRGGGRSARDRRTAHGAGDAGYPAGRRRRAATRSAS